MAVVGVVGITGEAVTVYQKLNISVQVFTGIVNGG
jgi:sugar diacid utilization regulator